MYIARRTGAGRGTFEIAGTTATGLVSGDLLDSEIVFEFPSLPQFPTGVVLGIQGGKHRLRMATAEIQIQRQFAAALLMPSPRRVNDAGSSPQVLKSKEYVIERIHIDFANHLVPGKAFIVPGIIEVQNLTKELRIHAQGRLAEVSRVWKNYQGLPEPLQTLIHQHERLVTSGQPIGPVCEKTVAKIQHEVSSLVSREPQQYLDALPTLVQYLELGAEFSDEPYVEHATTLDFEIENVIRLPRRIKRAIISRRGQWSFRRGLLVAYGQRCQVTQYTGESALEAAHIVPYSEGGEFTNDLRNGLLLRADIHTLFDLGLLKVAPKSLEVQIMSPLLDSSYAKLQGTILHTSNVLRPSNEALEYKWTKSHI